MVKIVIENPATSKWTMDGRHMVTHGDVMGIVGIKPSCNLKQGWLENPLYFLDFSAWQGRKTLIALWFSQLDISILNGY